MMTLKGEIPDDQLEKRELRENVPCGVCTTTSFWKDGELVRQDVLVEVDRGVLLGSQNGRL